MSKEKKQSKKKFQNSLKNQESRAYDKNAYMNAPVSKHTLKAFSLSRVKK